MATPRLEGRRGVKQRRRRLALYPLCRRCAEEGITTATEHINHIVPLAQDGPDTDENCEGLCEPCHKIITAEQFNHKAKVEYNEQGYPSTGPWADISV